MGQINTFLPDKEHEKLNLYSKSFKLNQRDMLIKMIMEYSSEISAEQLLEDLE